MASARALQHAALFIIFTVLITANGEENDECQAILDKNCINGQPPPQCSGTSDLLECVQENVDKAKKCPEETRKIVRGRLESVRLIEEIACNEVTFKRAFRENEQCWSTVASCTFGHLAKPMASDKRDPQSSDCQDSLTGLGMCKVSIRPCPEIAAEFVDDVVRELQCGAIVNSLNFMLFFLVSIVVFMISN